MLAFQRAMRAFQRASASSSLTGRPERSAISIGQSQRGKLAVAISVLMTQSFDQDILKAFDHTAEIEIETSRGEGAPVHRTTIWIVVDGASVYVRSVRGPAGRWFRELVANPVGAVHAGGSTVPVQAHAATDPATIERVSDAFKQKYQERWPGPTAAMLREETLPTTLQLEPR